MINLTELEKMCEAATKGPWWNESCVIHCKAPGWTPDNHACDHPVRCDIEEDADFVAHSRTAIPELLRLVREARGIISGARDAMRDMGCHPSTYETFDEWLSEVEQCHP